jgi:hypothetical protein
VAGDGAPIERDGGAEAGDRLVEPAEPAEQRAEVAVIVRPPRLERDGPAQMLDRRRRLALRVLNAGEQKQRVGARRIDGEDAAAERGRIGEAAPLIGAGGTAKEIGKVGAHAARWTTRCDTDTSGAPLIV